MCPQYTCILGRFRKFTDFFQKHYTLKCILTQVKSESKKKHKSITKIQLGIPSYRSILKRMFREERNNLAKVNWAWLEPASVGRYVSPFFSMFFFEKRVFSKRFKKKTSKTFFWEKIFFPIEKNIILENTIGKSTCKMNFTS